MTFFHNLNVLSRYLVIGLMFKLTRSVPFQQCLDQYCYYSDGQVKTTDLTNAQNYCTQRNNGEYLLEIYNDKQWQLFIASLLTANGYDGSYLILNSRVSFTTQFIGILNTSMPADFEISGSDNTAYVTNTGTTITIGTDKILLSYAYICMYSGPCSSSTNSYFQKDNCYVAYLNKVTWFEAENQCYGNGGHLATFSGFSYLQLKSSSGLLAILPSNTRFWTGFTQLQYDWMHSGRRVYFTHWEQEQPISTKSSLSAAVYFLFSSTDNIGWVEDFFTANDYTIFCMKELATSTELQTSTSPLTSSTTKLATSTELQTSTSLLTSSTPKLATSTELQTSTSLITSSTPKLATSTELQTSTSLITSSTPISEYSQPQSLGSTTVPIFSSTSVTSFVSNPETNSVTVFLLIAIAVYVVIAIAVTLLLTTFCY